MNPLWSLGGNAVFGGLMHALSLGAKYAPGEGKHRSGRQKPKGHKEARTARQKRERRARQRHQQGRNLP